MRLAFSLLPSYEPDQGFFRLWTAQLVEQGAARFFDDPQYKLSPGGMYGFWLAGLVKQWLRPDLSFYDPAFDLLLKLPANLADIGAGVLIYRLAARASGRGWAAAGFLLYVMNPVAIFNAAVWGQYDGQGAFFAVLAAYLRATGLAGLAWAAASFAVAVTIKPQEIAAAVPFGVHALRTARLPAVLLAGVAFVATVLAVYFPFFPSGPVAGIVQVNTGSANLFNCTTCFAFNFWGLFGNFVNDATAFAGLPMWAWGLALTGAAWGALLVLRPVGPRFTFPLLSLTLALFVTAAFMLLTRVHERYLFPAFPFLLLAALTLRSRQVLAAYGLLSAVHLANLYLVYDFQKGSPATPLGSFLLNNFAWGSAASVACFVLLVAVYLRTAGPAPARRRSRAVRRRRALSR